MIQIVFTDNGKLHTVTFSGENAEYWANRCIKNIEECINDGALITWEKRTI